MRDKTKFIVEEIFLTNDVEEQKRGFEEIIVKIIKKQEVQESA